MSAADVRTPQFYFRSDTLDDLMRTVIDEIGRPTNHRFGDGQTHVTLPSTHARLSYLFGNPATPDTGNSVATVDGTTMSPQWW